MLKYKLLCKKKTLFRNAGDITTLWDTSEEYWVDFCNKHSDTWEFLGEEDSIESNSVESFPVKPPAAKPTRKYLNRVNNTSL